MDRHGRWLLLMHQIPPKPDYLRVKVRRRLHRVGAVLLKNSVYVLPQDEEALEDFLWIRREIMDEGGEALVCAADFVEGMRDGDIEQLFRADADAEYRLIVDAVRAMAGPPSAADVDRLRKQLRQVRNRDRFAASGGEAAEQAVAELAARLRSGTARPEAGPPGVTRPIGATWVTREGVYVDRIASAWLIRRFIDPEARFKFVPGTGYDPEPGELRFDMYEGEFTHESDRCTFETLLNRFAPTDPALGAVAEIVHDIDLKDGKFDRPETEGVAQVLRGIALAAADDAARLAAGAPVFESLYRSFALPTEMRERE